MKGIQTKPMLYAFYLNELQAIAIEKGYNLVLHGSLQRDCDLIAIPWTNEPRPRLELIQAFHMKLRDACYPEEKNYMYSVLPGGRHSYVINLNRGGYSVDGENYTPDPQYYLDISVTPFPM